MSIREIGPSETNLIQMFLNNAQGAIQSFRYFTSRPLDIINNHVVTILLMDDTVPVGYGHLDRDGDTIWLGIALADQARGKKLGIRIMEYLIAAGRTQNISEIRLTVDKTNTQAITLYHKCGFQVLRDLNDSSFLMRLQLNNI